VSASSAAAWVGSVLVSVGAVALVQSFLMDPPSFVVRAWSRHIQRLDRALRFIRSRLSAPAVVRAQLAVTTTVTVVCLLTDANGSLALVPVIWIGPELALRHAHAMRVQQIEDQLGTWLLVLANGLRAVPSLGDAMAASRALIGGPLAEELDVALQEHRLGSPLNVAFGAMAARVRSPVLSAAVTTLDVARRTGGTLSQTLEQAAASLREMARLQGVVRTKTAESKSQAWVISLIPVVLIVVLQRACPELIEVLLTSSRGHVVLAMAGLLWVAAIGGAMRILQVDT